ncbi:YhjD/YihY/BrkB family envelope integrity protein [Kitasatospora sp. NPDC004240]
MVAGVWRRGREVELLHRSMAFGALCFVTLVPLLVVIAAASPTGGSGIADWVTDGLGLDPAGARAVNELFASRREVLSTTTAFGLALLAVFGVTLMGSVQNAFERIWQLRAGAWRGVWRQALALVGLVGYVLVAAWSGVPWPGSPVWSALRVVVTLGGGLVLFCWLPWLLLGGRIAWRRLLPGAVVTVMALAGLRVFSRLVFAPLVVSNAVSYGPVGTVLVVLSWLIGVGYTVYAGALVGRALDAVARTPRRRGPR